ncbi:hypothetical protein KCU89_g4835, partial [Aureobasidium melanogenum]
MAAQKECVPVVRARLPRGRNGGRKGINSELRNRINRLEGLVQSLNSGLLPDNPNLDSVPHKACTDSDTQTSTFPNPSSTKQQPFDSREATPDITKWPLGSTLWTQLAHELNDIHTVLDNEDDDDDHDEDIDSSPPYVPTDSSGTPGDMIFTSHMVFYNIHCHSNPLLRELNWVLPGEAELPPTPMQSSWTVRQEAIARLERTFEEDVIARIPDNGIFRFACVSFTKVLLRCAQLYAVRPLQRHPALTLPPPEHLNILLLAVEALEVKRGLLSETTEPWHWVIKGFVDWHGLAVLLAELCNPDQYDPQLLERAWTVGLVSFNELSGQIAEGTQGPLWKPIKKLMRVAQRKRQERSPASQPMIISGPSDNFVDDLSAYTTSAMDLMPMHSVMDVNQSWNAVAPDPLQASWFNWQSFTDDVAALNNGYTWGAMDFDPVFEGL